MNSGSRGASVLGSPKTWLKFYNHDYTRESKKEYKATYKVLMKKETEVPEALDLINFGTIHGGRSLQELDEFCRVSFSMDGGELVDVPWHVAKFLYDNAKVVQKKSKIIGAHLIGRIARHLGLMSHAALRVVTRGQETQLLDLAKLGALSIVRLRVIDDRIGEIDEHIYKLGYEIEEVIKLLSYHHLDHTYFDGTQYTYVPNIPDLGVEHGVYFISSPQTYFTAPPDPSANPFGLFGDVPSTFHHCGNDMDKE
ncbi:hypothetical protein Tco_0452597 [Tanacetum coccineum]